MPLSLVRIDMRIGKSPLFMIICSDRCSGAPSPSGSVARDGGLRRGDRLSGPEFGGFPPASMCGDLLIEEQFAAARVQWVIRSASRPAG
jgi:hypothetical protein